MDVPQLPRHQFQLEMDSDAMFISVPESSSPQYAPAKLCPPQHPGLYAPQPGTPPQLVPDAASWTSPQPCPQAWPTHQGPPGGAAGLEEALPDFTPWLEDFQGLQVCQGEPKLLHESQGVPQVSQCVLQMPQCVPQVPLGLQGVPLGLQESQGVPYFQQVCQDVPQVPQGPHGALQVGQGEPLESQQSPASQEGSPEGAVGPRRARRAPRPRRSKLYEREEPFEDPQQEKRRRDAINSKKNRDASKAKMTDLRRRVDAAATLRDNLRREVAALRQRETQLLAQLEGQAPAAASVTTLTPPGQGSPVAATLPPAATLAGTPQGTAFLPATTATTASLHCPSPHLTLATPYLPPTPPSSCMQADTLLTPTPSPGPYFSPFTPPTPHPPH
ncbi:LIM domain-binding protein 3-like [Eriocheir sinensis]|uniref:LIM domain-binding protein 3-like n=1 Tax=Eriocheir sinensis TaxID=95602 RepID=UPI0021C75A11|nr:LIM domain-binding protein 3-like [Eriocheir sinensis]XP_050739964.1 LIM domain-binding protein 3-like [Eriocheir sinensis]XP_050739965.1 LIM domain-binding protein 3-like [Eriocheir sinensis]XP_050739966.1 LIM domain-binding protein 3-like [Eriocheir sinensis]XP_050739967.1 LIM domain-binding protein 3-like [Eriocheir sinensis]XP_050739968.1 LIM domain-binding protein 3-like [Eriocheir sinensis]XP_050739969.1 LIM domain-binding protein 3-like [Eriocheir sinensis]XP_050739970.1 LIM domain